MDWQLALGALQTHRPDKQCDREIFSPAFSLMTDEVTNLHTKNMVRASARSFLHHHLLSQQWVIQLCPCHPQLPVRAILRLLQEEINDICSASSHGFYTRAAWEGWEQWGCAGRAPSNSFPCPVQPFHSESVSLQWLEINCKIRMFCFLMRAIYNFLSIQFHRRGKGDPLSLLLIFICCKYPEVTAAPLPTRQTAPVMHSKKAPPEPTPSTKNNYCQHRLPFVKTQRYSWIRVQAQ